MPNGGGTLTHLIPLNRGDGRADDAGDRAVDGDPVPSGSGIFAGGTAW